ncbi:MAG: hypothetical protein ACLFUJ_02870 [Phycisphaerae bacterium]
MSDTPRTGLWQIMAVPVTSTPLRALLWGTSLCVSIVVTSLQLFPAMMGRVILGLIALGFGLFSIARASLRTERRESGFVATDLARPMRLVYWIGYALMFTGVGLSVLIFAAR